MTTPFVNEEDFIVTQIAAVEAQIAAYNTAILALTVDGKLSYSFDDGQTRQTVTRQSIGQLQNAIDSLMNRRASFYAMLGRGAAYVRPGF
jgi:hypothetical protein